MTDTTAIISNQGRFHGHNNGPTRLSNNCRDDLLGLFGLSLMANKRSCRFHRAQSQAPISRYILTLPVASLQDLRRDCCTCRTASYPAVPRRTAQYHAVPSRTQPYRAVPCSTVPYRSVPRRTAPRSAVGQTEPTRPSLCVQPARMASHTNQRSDRAVNLLCRRAGRRGGRPSAAEDAAPAPAS